MDSLSLLQRIFPNQGSKPGLLHCWQILYQSGKELTYNAGDIRDAGSTSGAGRSFGKGNGNPLKYSCLDNPMDEGAWRVMVHGLKESDVAEAT